VSAGCGGDDDESADRPPATTPVTTVAPPVTTPPPETTVTPSEPDPGTATPTVPAEEQQGDEEAIRSEAVFSGRGGRLTPLEVRVPAFIAIRVILRSTDDRAYSLRIDGQRLSVGPGRPVDEAALDGLLPNRAYTGAGPRGHVRIVASAEPGP
jgi:hypothetical protein